MARGRRFSGRRSSAPCSYPDINAIRERRARAAAGDTSVDEYVSNELKQDPRWCKVMNRIYEKCADEYGSEHSSCELSKKWLMECNAKKGKGGKSIFGSLFGK